MSNFQKLAAARVASLPTVTIEGQSFFVKPFKPLAMEMSKITGICTALAHANYYPSPGDDAPFTPPAKTDGGFQSLLDAQGFYRARTVKDGEIAQAAAIIRSTVTFAFQLVDADGKRPWIDDLEQFAALVELVQNDDDLSNQIGILSGITKAVEDAQASKEQSAEVEPGN